MMKKLFRAVVVFGLSMILGSFPARAAEASPAEIKLREMARNAMLQLREAQAKIDTLTAAQAQSDREKAEQKKKIEELTRQGEADRKAAEKEREKLSVQMVLLQRLVADHETKNGELIKLANEILTRYEKFGIGDALTAREPFIGLTRVKIQNLVQDYQDKVSDQRITHDKRPPPESARENPPSPPAGQEEKTGAEPSGEKKSPPETSGEKKPSTEKSHEKK
jgi:hypothetical protein